MPPRPRPPCVVCKHQTSKYACATCRADYCSVACYKTHRETCAPGADITTAPPREDTPALAPSEPPPAPAPDPLETPTPLRPLTSLKWPYIPDAPYFDPLTRDDPKPLQLPHYEALATSPELRALLEDPTLCAELTRIDGLRGANREEAVKRALGVDGRLSNEEGARVDDETRAFRAFAEAIEKAIRGGREDALGLDWD